MGQNLVKNKKMFIWIRKQCEKLPAMNYIALPKEFGYDPAEKNKRKVVKKWYDVPTEYPINHYRRAKRLYLKLGLSGVDQYFRAFGYQLSALTLKKD